MQDAVVMSSVYDDISIKLVQEACKDLGERENGLFWFPRAVIESMINSHYSEQFCSIKAL